MKCSNRNTAIHAAAPCRLTVDDPLPDLLRTPGPEAPELASSLVMQGDRWFVPDGVFERLTGDGVAALNERATRKGLGPIAIERTQVIDFACDSFSSIPKRGPAGRLYALDDAVALLAATENFSELHTRESATEAPHAAFEWAQQHADTNPAELSLPHLATVCARRTSLMR